MATQGMAGGVDPFVPNPAPWSAVRISDYGYTKMQVFNHTHLKVEQVSAVKVRWKLVYFQILQCHSYNRKEK